MSITIAGVVTNGVIVPSLPLPEGTQVQVLVPEQEVKPTRRSTLEILATLPPGPLLFKTPDDVNQYIQAERDSWDR